MTTRRTRTIVLVSAIAVLVLGVIAWFVVPQLYAASQPEAAPPPTVAAPTPSTDPPVTESGQSGSFAGDWQIGEGSFAGYRVDEVLNGADVTVTGRTEQVSGSVTTTEDSVTAATIEVDVASIATDNPTRDEYFTSTALETDLYPTATFELTETATTDATIQPGTVTTIELVGDLTMHGVAQPVTLQAEVAITDSGAQVAGSIPITFADYDVEAPSLGFVEVEDTGFVEFSLQLAR